MPARQPPPVISLPRLSRRSLLGFGAVGLGVAAAPLAAQVARGFTHGVASGEPAAKSVLLWTRHVASGPTRLRYEVSETADFAKVAAGGVVTAAPGRDWCAKAVATGLAPGTWYHYRFVAPDGTMSATGRTRTLPEGPTDRFRMAVFSCSNLGFGHFNAYAHAAQEDAFDLAVHLGDYLYEYERGSYPADAQVIDGRYPDPASEMIHLADYRLRYASYRRDPDLLRLHQLFPMISVIDDHETANDAWKGGAQNHSPETEGTWSARVRAAMQARSEWMPVSDAPWAQYEIGDLATLFRLESRLTARVKPLDLASVTKGLAPEAYGPALEAFRTGAWTDPKRTLLGPKQERWLAGAMAKSVRSGRKWQVLAQQIVMGRLRSPPDLLDLLPQGTPDFVRDRVGPAVAASGAGLPFSMDTWSGYPAARDRLLDASRNADANLVVLAGDSHNAWACELAGAGVEFAGHSVTSPGFESYFGFMKPADLAGSLVAANPELKWADTSRRGYMAIELTPQAAACEWRFTSSVRQRSADLAGTHRMYVKRGTNRLATG